VSCLEPVPSEVGVSTEEIIFTSGEKLVITGRILATSEINLTDHGFLISEDENFGSAEKLSLGERLTPGRFVGEFENLNIDNDYFIKSFIEDGSGIVEGNIKTFSTLRPEVVGISPRIAPPNSKIVIEGRNFTKEVKVFFGDRELNIINNTDESFITVNTPSIQGEVFEKITVEIEGQSFEAPYLFEFVIGTWKNETDLFTNSGGLEGLIGSVSFFDESTGEIVYGLGARNGFKPYRSEIFHYNCTTNESEITFFPGAGFGFGWVADGFMGGGSEEFIRPIDKTYTLLSSFYRYNESGDFVYLGEAPFKLLKASAQRIDDVVYVFGGLEEDNSTNTKVYAYNIKDNVWKENGTFPFWLSTNSDFPSFLYEGQIYFLSDNQELYKFDPASKEVDFLTTYPATVSQAGLAQVIGSKAYIGVFNEKRLIYELDLASLVWKEKTGFSGSIRDEVITSWIKDDQLWLIKNGMQAEEPMQVWSFKPEAF